MITRSSGRSLSLVKKFRNFFLFTLQVPKGGTAEPSWLSTYLSTAVFSNPKVRILSDNSVQMGSLCFKTGLCSLAVHSTPNDDMFTRNVLALLKKIVVSLKTRDWFSFTIS